MAGIELVIKIPEDVYTRLFDNGIQDNEIAVDDVCETARALRLGIPLPKGHGRLIDADNTISKICGSSCGCHFEECGYDEPCFSVTRIESAPTIIKADKAESEDKECK